MGPALSPGAVAQEMAACAVLGGVLGAARAVLPTRGRAAFLPDMLFVGAVLMALQSYAVSQSQAGQLRGYMALAAVCAAASIDLKKDEPGLAAFCKAHGWPITFYPADELRAVPGQFTPSAFVASVTGVDNVCERSAVKASGGMLLLPKTAGGGVTLALAVRPFAPDWRTEQ